MGTRNLTCVFVNGEYKVAQYGQWDGYPSGSGVEVLDFCRSMNLGKFLESLKNCYWISEEENKSRWSECGANDSGWVNSEVSAKHNQLYPENSRDTGSEILEIVYNSEKKIGLVNSIDFAKDSLFCEWAYIIDLDKNKLECFEGFNKNKLEKSERFFTEEPNKEGYYPIKINKYFDLDKLPSEEDFLLILEPREDE